MRTTSVSLLDRARNPEDDAAWQRLHDLYRPLILHYLKRDHTLRQDAEDLVQDVLVTVVRELPTFQRQNKGSFRSWIRNVTHNRLLAYWRKRQRLPRQVDAANDENCGQLSALADPNSDLSKLWDQDHDDFVLRRLLELIEPDFQPTTWRAFTLLVHENRPAEEVAQALHLSPNAVLIAKSRVLKRLREEAAGLID